MGNTTSRIVSRAGAAVAALTISSSAFAGGFAIREQSTEGQGASFAGIAAGGAPSSMFWNPATMTQSPGRTMEQGVAGILPRASQGGTSTLAPFGFTAGTDNSATSALVLNGYNIWQWNQNLWIGVSTNSTFGLSVGFPNPAWAGAAYGQSTSLKTYNATPSVAYKLNDWISIGAGFQIQYATVNFTGFNGVAGLATPNLALLSGNGWAYGWTAGITLTPWMGTQIGVGYRSSLDQDIDGAFAATGGLSTPGAISTTLKLPGMVSVGVRQRINAQFTALGTFEWTNWSRIGTSIISQANGAPALGSTGAAVTVPFQYRDGYFYSGGLEYIINPAWTARFGVAFEQSPITDQVRVPRLPDNDRMWYSVGLTNAVTPNLNIDLAYSYIDVKETPINVSAASGNPAFNGAVTYIGNVSSFIHILSISVRYRFDGPPAAVSTRG